MKNEKSILKIIESICRRKLLKYAAVLKKILRTKMIKVL